MPLRIRDLWTKGDIDLPKMCKKRRLIDIKSIIFMSSYTKSDSGIRTLRTSKKRCYLVFIQPAHLMDCD